MAAKGAAYALSVLRAAFLQSQSSSSGGYFQTIDARVKVLFLICMVIVVSVRNTILPEALMAVFLFGLVLLSRLSLVEQYGKVLLLTFIFGFLLALPSAFNIVTPGNIIMPFWNFGNTVSVGPITLPATIGVTAEGLKRITLLSLRVMNSLTITFLVLSTTPFMEFIRAMKSYRVPDVFLLTISLAYKYILIFTLTVFDMHLARKSRLAGPERNADSRTWAAGRIAFLFRKSQQRCDDVFRAMTARGMSGDMKLRAMPPLTTRNFVEAFGVIGAAGLFLWI
jgi:cobalt ECF transporter T component CbiQ